MILFLDFDGVLHPVGSTEKMYFSKLHILEQFLREEALCWRVVISSSWREYYSWQYLLQIFSEDLRKRFIGITPADDNRMLHTTWGAQARLYPREIQIRHFLAQRCLDAEEWVALDDKREWFRDPETNERLVLCDPNVGVSECEKERLRVILSWPSKTS